MVARPADNSPLTSERQKLADSFGYKTRLGHRFVLDEKVTNAVQTRSIELDEAIVRQYMESMAGGAQFPLPLITEDKGVVAGKHTVEAMRRRGVKYFDALVLKDVYYINAGTPLLQDLMLMDVYSNQTNGVRMTAEDLAPAIGIAYSRNIAPDKIAQMLAVNVRTVTHAINGFKGVQRITELGETTDGLNGPQIANLGKMSRGLNDAPFLGLVKLTRDARLRVNEQTDWAARMRNAKSDAAATKILTEARVEFKSRIREAAATGKRGPRVRTHWEMFTLPLQHIAKYAGREDEVLHREPVGDPEFAAQALLKLRIADEVLQKVIAGLE